MLQLEEKNDCFALYDPVYDVDTLDDICSRGLNVKHFYNGFVKYKKNW